MKESTAPEIGGTETDPKDAQKSGAPTWAPPATQADLDRIISDRLARERAKYSDYAELKESVSPRKRG